MQRVQTDPSLPPGLHLEALQDRTKVRFFFIQQIRNGLLVLEQLIGFVYVVMCLAVSCFFPEGTEGTNASKSFLQKKKSSLTRQIRVVRSKVKVHRC